MANQSLIRQTPNMGIATVPTEEERQQQLAIERLEIGQHLSGLQLSPRTGLTEAIKHVKAKMAGTPVAIATDEQLSSMWTQVVNLIKLELKNSDDEEAFFDSLLDLNDWVRRQYGPKNLTCEQVALAYNALVMEELTKPDGLGEYKVIQAYKGLDAKYFGEIIAAYLRKVDNDVVVHQLFREGKVKPDKEAKEATPEEIEQSFLSELQYAIDATRDGNIYKDFGNELFGWLIATGRAPKPTQDKWEATVIQAKKDARADLVSQKSDAVAHEGYGETKRERAYSRGGMQAIGEVLGDRLAEIMQENTPFYEKTIRAYAYQILLTDYLREVAGPITKKANPDRDPLLSVPVPESPFAKTYKTIDNQTIFKPMGHFEYINTLKERLPEMDKAVLIGLKADARKKNTLDVYELVTAELDSRTEKNGKR